MGRLEDTELERGSEFLNVVDTTDYGRLIKLVNTIFEQNKMAKREVIKYCDRKTLRPNQTARNHLIRIERTSKELRKLLNDSIKEQRGMK